MNVTPILKLRAAIWHAVRRYFPRINKDHLFQLKFGRKIDWKHPRDMNEWINWLSIYSDTSQWPMLADKYAVRSFIEECGYGDTLVPLLGVWRKAQEIDFTKLPKQFVMKCNNGSGDAAIVRDNTAENVCAMEQTRQLMKQNLERRFGIETAEPHYLKIKPRIIAEELLEASKQSVKSTSLVDYKIWCIHGQPQACYVVTNRKKGRLVINLFDVDWNNIDDNLAPKQDVIGVQPIPQPENWARMLEMAAALSKGFPQMRVDLYEVDGKLYFGELTLTTTSGRIDYFTDDYLKRLGDMIAVGMPKR